MTNRIEPCAGTCTVSGVCLSWHLYWRRPLRCCRAPSTGGGPSGVGSSAWEEPPAGGAVGGLEGVLPVLAQKAV